MFKRLTICLFIAVFASSISGEVFARQLQNNLYNSFFPGKYASLVVDADNGNILEQSNANVTRYPASLTKMMTLYLTFQALKAKRLDIYEQVTVSRHAASQPRMNLALRAGERIRVNDLIKSVVVLSANDSAVVLAEKLGGTEGNFAKKMTATAKQLGMNNTNFANASGLPNSSQVTTAKDMAKLLVALKRDFPQYYNMLSQTKFVYKGRTLTGHNRMMVNYAGAKAGKTGFINASGFNLALNAERGGKNLVGVVMGGRTAQSRDNFMRKILDNNFAMLARNEAPKQASNFQTASIVKKPAITAKANIIKQEQPVKYAFNNIKKQPTSLNNSYQPAFYQLVNK